MMTPDDIDVWVGLDVGKSAHHAHALDHDGNTLYDKPLKQDEKAIRTMLGKLSKHGRVLLVVDQPNTIGSLPLTVARNMGIAVAYLPRHGHAQDRAAAARGREDRPQGRACDRVGRAQSCPRRSGTRARMTRPSPP